MRLVTFEHAGVRRVGALTDSSVADLEAVLPDVHGDLCRLIATWDADEVARARREAPVIPLGQVRLQAPLRPPKDVIAVGRNYRDHAVELSASGVDASEREVLPPAPVLFSKARTAVIGPDEPIRLANDPTGTTDYEGELGVVIGRTCRNVPPERALEHVFGWTAVNDVTARALQQRHVQWYLGKSPDTFCPIGPCVTTVDELPDVRAAHVRTRVNGALRQDMHVADLVHDVPSLIATLSAVLTLEPGDVIATGTGTGVGIGFDPPVYLAAGDVVEVSVDGVGTLRNPVE